MEAHKKNECMTEEILNFMENRPKNKNLIEDCDRTDSLIEVKVKEAKDEYLQRSCIETEQLQWKHDDIHIHKKIKMACGYYGNGPNIVGHNITAKARILWPHAARTKIQVFTNNRDGGSSRKILVQELPEIVWPQYGSVFSDC